MAMYRFGRQSIDRLCGVHPELVLVTSRALLYTPVDFAVAEGVRDLETQKRYVADGKSETLDSFHLTGDAIDAHALVGGKVTWFWDHYVSIAEAVHRAASELGIPITWGAAWKRNLIDYPSAAEALKAYRADCAAKGKKPFLDGPHYQRYRR